MQHFGKKTFLPGDTIVVDKYDEALGLKFISCMQINIKVSKSYHYSFWWKQPDLSKVSKYEVNNFFAIYYEKSIATAFGFYCDVKHSNILWGSCHVCFYFFWLVVVKNGSNLLEHDSKIYYKYIYTYIHIYIYIYIYNIYHILCRLRILM